MVVFPALACGADRGVAGDVSQRSDDDPSVVFRALAWEPDQEVLGHASRRPEDDSTVILPPLAWETGQIVVGNLSQQPPGFQPRPALLEQLDRAGDGAWPALVLTGMRGAGTTQLAAAYARAKLAAGWRLVAWVNAADTASLLTGLAAVAAAMGLPGVRSGRDGTDLGRAVRQRLEADGERCLLVFDDVQDPDVVRPFVVADGAARVLITSTRQPVPDLGTTVPVDGFSEEEALAFLGERTGLADADGAALVAAEMGCLPLALAQVTSVIAGRHLDYRTYLHRLSALRAEEYLTQEEQQPYLRRAAESVLLSLEAIRADDPAGLCVRVLEIMAVLSAAGVRRELLQAAGQSGVLARRRLRSRVNAALVDRALARLAERSLLTFSLDGQTVIAHSLVMRVLRERLARQGRLAKVCRAAASVLDARAETLAGSPDRAAVRDVTEQATALRKNAARLGAEAGDELARCGCRTRSGSYMT